MFDCDDLWLDEIEVYNIALKWAGAECSRQNLRWKYQEDVIGDTIYSFVNGSIFCNNIYDRSILTVDEKCDVVKQILLKDDQNTNSFMSLWIQTKNDQNKNPSRFLVNQQCCFVSNHRMLRFSSNVSEEWWDEEDAIISLSFFLYRNAHPRGILMYSIRRPIVSTKYYHCKDAYPYTLTISKETEIIFTRKEDGSAVDHIRSSVTETYTPVLLLLVSFISAAVSNKRS